MTSKTFALIGDLTLFSQNTSALRNSEVGLKGGYYLSSFPPSHGVSKPISFRKEGFRIHVGNTKEGWIKNFLCYVGKFKEISEEIVN